MHIYPLVTAQELDILIFLYQSPRCSGEIARFLSLDNSSVGAYLHRLRQRELITSTGRQYDREHKLSDKGRDLILELKRSLFNG